MIYHRPHITSHHITPTQLTLSRSTSTNSAIRSLQLEALEAVLGSGTSGISVFFTIHAQSGQLPAASRIEQLVAGKRSVTIHGHTLMVSEQ